MFKTLTISASALLAASAVAAPAAAAELPAIAVAMPALASSAGYAGAPIEQMHHKRKHRGKGKHRDDYRGASNRYPAYQPRDGYGEQANYNTRVWQGDDGRQYCRRSDGTTGLLIGGAAGALLGRELAGNGDRTLGTILGAAGGALLGREVEKRVVRCR